VDESSCGAACTKTAVLSECFVAWKTPLKYILTIPLDFVRDSIHPSIHPPLYCETTTTTIDRCGPCRLTVPVVKDVMKQYSGELEVVEVCTDDLAEVAEDAGVVSIPTIQFYYDGAALETHSIVGCVAKSVLSNAVQKVIEDVAQIRK
jgi:thioredoxin 1